MLVLKQQLKEARIPQAVVARAVDVSEATLAQIVNHNAWPRTSPGEVRRRLASWLESQGIDTTKSFDAVQGAATPRTAGTTDKTSLSEEENMLLKKQVLFPATKKAFGLFRDPFADEAMQGSDDVFTTPDIRYVREALYQTARHGGFMAVIGESGAGKAQVPFHGARAQILAVDKQIVAVKGQITETRESLRALIGAGASDMPEIRPVALPQVQTGIPATLSYELLARRPDLQAMRWYVQASLDQVDSARALFYPSFDIKAFFGLDSIHLHTLFKKTSRQFNFIPGLKLPLFDGGRLNANLEGTRAASNMMIERYNQSVLNAVRDVAVNGTRLQTLNDEREMQAERVEATRFTQRAAEAAYQRGLTSRLQATEARLPVLAEEMSLLMLDSRRVIQSIQLMKSLGGGYQAGPVVEKK